jgi:hypothetical protein
MSCSIKGNKKQIAEINRTNINSFEVERHFIIFTTIKKACLHTPLLIYSIRSLFVVAVNFLSYV